MLPFCLFELVVPPATENPNYCVSVDQNASFPFVLSMIDGRTKVPAPVPRPEGDASMIHPLSDSGSPATVEAAASPNAPPNYINAADYPTLDAAVSAAVSQSGAGIYIPASTIATASSTITVPSGFTILGGDPATSIINFVTLPSSQGLIATNASNIVFRNLVVTTTATTVDTDFDTGLIDIADSSHITVQGVTFANAPGKGLFLNHTSNSIVDGNKVIGCQLVKMQINGDNNIITNNTINGGPWYGIAAAGRNDLIAGNYITRLTGTQSFGILFQGLSHSIIKNNTIEYVEHYGMYADGTDTHDNAVIDNIIRGMGIVDGVHLDESGTAIQIRGGAANNLFAKNQLPDELGYGIGLAGRGFSTSDHPDGIDASNNILSGNTITDAKDPGISISGTSNVTVRNNTISSPYSVALSIGDEHDDASARVTQSPHSKILNNTFSNNWLEGIWATGISNSTIMGNTIQNNSTGVYPDHFPTGITIMSWGSNGASQNNQIIGNRVNGQGAGTAYGIYLAPGQGNNIVRFNDLSGNSVAGVKDDSGTTTNVISDNRMTETGTELERAPPVADAGPAGLVAEGATVTLDGSRTHLLAGRAAISYSWIQIYGPPVTIADPKTAKATFTAPTGPAAQLLGFRLTASTPHGSTFDEVYCAVDPSLPMP